MTFHHILFAFIFVGTIAEYGDTLVTYPYWISYHPLYGKNLQGMFVESTVHLLSRFE